MASNVNNLLLVLAFTAVASASIAQGIVVNGPTLLITNITVNVGLTCIPGIPAVNATVVLTCGSAIFATAQTNLIGTALLTYTPVVGGVFDSSNCTATVTLQSGSSCGNSQPVVSLPVNLQLINILVIKIGIAISQILQLGTVITL